MLLKGQWFSLLFIYLYPIFIIFTFLLKAAFDISNQHSYPWKCKGKKNNWVFELLNKSLIKFWYTLFFISFWFRDFFPFLTLEMWNLCFPKMLLECISCYTWSLACWLWWDLWSKNSGELQVPHLYCMLVYIKLGLNIYLYIVLKISSAACGYGFTLLSSKTMDLNKIWGMGLNKDSQIGFHRSRKDKCKYAKLC